ncbi:MAG: SAM-dependent methyltransferase [bacterium]
MQDAHVPEADVAPDPDAADKSASRTALAEELAAEVRRRVFDEPGLMRLTQVARRGGTVKRTSLRPLQLKGVRQFQVETAEGGRVSVRNLEAPDAVPVVERLLDQKGARELHLVTASGDLHIRVTRKGKELVSRSKPLAREVDESPAHDHVKRQPLQSFDADALLRVTGIADADGRIKPSMRGKYDQINEFLRLFDGIVAERPAGAPLLLADCGCGKAYLTFAAYFYLARRYDLDVQVRGIERNTELVETVRRMAEDLGVARDVQFLAEDLATCRLAERPEVVMSLHACDTATDEALARAVEWGSRVILCAPCCQHELQGDMNGGGPMRAVLRHGILRERLADILADTFRAQILRILGYRVNVMEFVSPEATARNLMLRAEYAVKPGQQQAIGEYLELRDLWQVKPCLETRLASRLERHLTRMEGGVAAAP